MAIYHLSVKTIGRSKGRSAIACAAYRSGTRLYDQETRQTQDYRRKRGVVYTEIVLPENAPLAYADRETLWNAVQDVETRSNARLAREFEAALPNELTFELQKKCVQEFAQMLAEQGMIADVCIHKRHKKKTDQEDEKKNDHVHIMATTRGFDAKGRWAPKEKKVYALDENGDKIPLIDPETGLQKVRVRPGKGEEKLWKQITVEANDWNKKENMELWRASWAEICNRALMEIGSTERIDHRSYKDQGIDKIPTIHEGYAAHQIEARGGKSELCEYNRKVREANGLCVIYDLRYAKLEAEKETIEEELAAENKRLAEEEHARIEAEHRAQEQAKAQAAAAKSNTKQRLTPEQYQQINRYFGAKEEFWNDYRRAKELADKELRAAYKDRTVRAAYGRYKQAEYMVQHSVGILTLGLSVACFLLAKKDYERELKRVEAAKNRVNRLRELSKEAASLNAVQRNLREANQLTDDFAKDILAQQQAINLQLKSVDTALYLRGHEHLENLIPEVDWEAQRMLDILKEDRLRRQAEAEEAARKTAERQAAAERRRQTYGQLIQAQAEWIGLSRTAVLAPVGNQFEEKAERLKVAIETFKKAQANQMAAENAVRRAAPWKRSSLKEGLEKARQESREAYAALIEFGVSKYYNNKPLVGGQMDDEQAQAVVYNANAIVEEIYRQSEIEKKRGSRERDLKSRNELAEAQKRFKEMCRTVPVGQRDEAILALREATGDVDQATRSKLESFYAEMPVGSATWDLQPQKSGNYDGQAGDGNVR